MQSSRKSLIAGMGLGAVAVLSAAILMGQGANQPVKSETQYFVTADGDHAPVGARVPTFAWSATVSARIARWSTVTTAMTSMRTRRARPRQRDAQK